MKRTLLCFLTASAIAISSMQAASVLSEVTSDSPAAAGFSVAITSDNLPDGSVKFRVAIFEREATFSKRPSTTLSIVKVMDASKTVTPVRQLASEKQGNSIVCVFSVDKAALDDPAVSFVFTNYVERMVDGKMVPMPSADIVYARLRQFAIR